MWKWKECADDTSRMQVFLALLLLWLSYAFAMGLKAHGTCLSTRIWGSVNSFSPLLAQTGHSLASLHASFFHQNLAASDYSIMLMSFGFIVVSSCSSNILDLIPSAWLFTYESPRVQDGSETTAYEIAPAQTSAPQVVVYSVVVEPSRLSSRVFGVFCS